ncbi:MAG: amino acid decarboxylase, partial [Saprospiraceae bacterium]
LCRYFYDEIQKLGFEVGPFPELSVCIYRYIPESGDANKFNEHLHTEVIKHGRIFISTTSIDGIYWIRLAVLSFRTHLKEIDLLLNIIQSSLQKLLSNKNKIQ